MRVLKWHKPII